MHSSELDLTVAMCTFNRRDWALDALFSLEQVRVPKGLEWEVLVVDNNSSDGTFDALLEYRDRTALPMRVVRESAIGLSRARNRVIQEARGEIVSLFDDDELFDPGYLEALVEAFSDPKVDMVCGRILLNYEGGRPGWLQPEWEGFLSGVDAGDQGFRIARDDFVFSGANLAFVRDAASRWGYFDVNLSRQGKLLIGGGDVKFCKAAFHAGAHVRYEPRVLLFHKIPRHRATKRHFRELRFRAGESYGRIEKRSFNRTFLGIPLYAFPLLIKMVAKYLRLLLVERSPYAFRQQLNVVFHLGWMYGLWRKWRGDTLVART